MGIEQELRDALDDIFLYGWPRGFKADFKYRKPTFETHVGESGCTWLIPAVTVIPNRGDHLYRTSYADVSRKGKGFAGGTLILPLLDGSDFELKGGWMGNSRQCFEDTGVDCRNMHMTYGAVGLHRLPGGYMPGLYGLLHQDKAPQIGEYHRVENIAQQLANERKERVQYTVIAFGGGSAGGKDPE